MPDGLTATTETLGALLDDVRRQLRSSGIEDAPRQARLLISALLDIAPATFIGHPETLISQADREKLQVGLEQRLAGMPIGRIAGRREFYGRDFRLGPATLEPRPDSEVLIDAALQVAADAGWREKPLRIVDVGTGTGCLLITLLAELPNATGVGIDVAAEALLVAKQNAQAHGVAARASFVEADVLDGVEGLFDLLVSNPPYIRSDEIAGLDEAVRDHDPMAALDGGADGMTFYRRIASEVGRVVPDGWMMFEVGAGMADAVCLEIDAICGQKRRRNWKVWQDINGHERCVAAKTLNDLRL